MLDVAASLQLETKQVRASTLLAVQDCLVVKHLLPLAATVI